MKEVTIINYVLQRLAEIEKENDIAVLKAELEMARKAIEVAPCYKTEELINALFGTVEVNEDAE